MTPFSLECVTVCVGYSDFLAETAPLNMPHLDHWVIVTTPEDEETRNLCRRLGLKCLATSDFFEGGASFNKAKGINKGLEQLSKEDWVLHLDADIVLPPHYRTSLRRTGLREDCLYGADRLNCYGWDAWQRFKASGFLWQDWCYRLNFPREFEVGARFVHHEYSYVPIGFHQLYHGGADVWRGVATRRYPERSCNAARTDVQHALQWDRAKRLLLPEVLVVHLDSCRSTLGANWGGRTTPRFGPAGGGKSQEVSALS